MPNMLDYLAWRGDLTVQQDALNENDELILSQLAYVAFGDFVPGQDDKGEAVSLKEAVSALLDCDPDAEHIHQTSFMWKNNRELLAALRDSKRFGSMQLSNYVDSFSEEDEKQFAAVTIGIGDGTTLAAFRGTDDTLIGWKEDLNMVLDCPVPAQEEAVAYLERVAQRHPGALRVSGHSKGGNLTVYSASHCTEATERQLLTIVSHDGQGLDKGTIASEGYGRIRDRLRVYIPHFSFVGMLLEHEDNYTIVQSDANTLLQHDAFSWQMHGTKMVYADRPSDTSLSTNRIIRQWIETLTPEQQRLFIEAVYEVASTTYGETLPEGVTTGTSVSLQTILSAIWKLDPELRTTFYKVLGQLFTTAIKNIRFPWQKEEKEELPEEDLASLLSSNPKGEKGQAD